MDLFYKNNHKNLYHSLFILGMIFIISWLHYSTPTMKMHFHLLYMQAYFIPILYAAFQFGTVGGVTSAILVCVAYLPHIMLQWGGFVETNLVRFLQLGLFLLIGWMTGERTRRERKARRAAEKNAIELEQSLRKLNMLTQELSQMEEHLRMADRLAVVGELTASLAHEVRNPLGSILGTVEILKEEVALNSQQEKFVNILLEETRRIASVVETYLNYASHPKAGRQLFFIKEAVNKILALTRHRSRKANVTIKTIFPDEDTKVYGSEDAMTQILMNLMMNAFQALPHGGEIRLGLMENSQLEHAVDLIIEDNGSGMTPEVMNRIFKPFFTTKSDGTGLGLAIVKRLCDENNWNIAVESEPGIGTKMIITLPVNADSLS